MVLLWAPLASATSVLVVVNSTEGIDPAPLELRLRSELAAEGFEVVVTSSATTPNLEQLEALAHQLGTTSAIAATAAERGPSATLWVMDARLGLDIVKELHVSSTERDPIAVFALRAVEALRGAQLELEQQRRLQEAPPITNREPTVEPVPAPSAQAAKSPELSAPPVLVQPRAGPESQERGSSPSRRREGQDQPKPHRPSQGRDSRSFEYRPRLSVWLGLLSGRDQLGAAFVPALGFGLPLHHEWLLETVVIAPMLADLHRAEGSANVDQEFALLRVHRSLSLDRNWSLDMSLGGGVSRYAVSGSAASGYVGLHRSLWSLTASAHGGLNYRLGPRWWLLGEMGLWLRSPAPGIDFADREVSQNSAILMAGFVGVGRAL